MILQALDDFMQRKWKSEEIDSRALDRIYVFKLKEKSLVGNLWVDIYPNMFRA